MARSWSRRGIPLKVWLGLLLVGAGAVFGWQQVVRHSTPFKDTRALEISSYLERPSTLRGGVFTLSGTVHQTLASSASDGRLILVMTLTPRGSQDAPEPLPLQIPQDLIARMQTGRQFIFKVLVGEGGVLFAQDAAEI